MTDSLLMSSSTSQIQCVSWRASSSLNPRVVMAESGAFDYIQYFDTIPGSYRMERYEHKCLLYIDLFDFRWEVTSISNSKIEISSFTYYAPKDTVVPTALTLEK